jgi:phosphoribosyl-AMP cyclohydrolase
MRCRNAYEIDADCDADPVAVRVAGATPITGNRSFSLHG